MIAGRIVYPIDSAAYTHTLLLLSLFIYILLNMYNSAYKCDTFHEGHHLYT